MPQKIPNHVAVIMDGNGRWAQEKGLPRIAGHQAGADSALKLTRACLERQIPFLTLFAFSSENWKRPEPEVSFLMNLLDIFITNNIEELHQSGVCFNVIGRLQETSALPLTTLKSAIEKTKHNRRLRLTLALNYGSRAEIVDAVGSIVHDVQEGRLTSKDIDEELFSRYLYTYPAPDPDLLIRTSGEMRLSNFLLWQLSYTEIYITSKYWPDFSTVDFHAALEEYSKRKRRFGDIVAHDIA